MYALYVISDANSHDEHVAHHVIASVAHAKQNGRVKISAEVMNVIG